MINIPIPFLGANDDSCAIVDIVFKNGDFVKKGQLLFVVETTKSAIDIEAEEDGYFYYSIKIGERKKYGEIAAIIVNNLMIETEALALIDKANQPKVLLPTVRITKKAELLMIRNKISEEEIIKYAKEKEINEALIKSYIAESGSKNRRLGIDIMKQRVAIIGGVGGGGALIIADVLHRNEKQLAVSIYDNNKMYHGRNVLGIPVIGGDEELIEDFKSLKFDAIVIAFNRDLDERQAAYDRFASMGIPFANVIDSSVEIRSGVQIGYGNVILAKTYIAACTTIGDNNFISSNVCLEHGNILGSHNAFGPGVFTSGNVEMKDKIRFGTGVFVEPNLVIGSNVVLGSFVLVNKSISDNTILKRKQDYIIKEH